MLNIGLQLVAWVRQKQTQNADTVDIAWTLGIIANACLFVWLIPTATVNRVMVLLFPLLWYLRLLGHLVLRYDVAHEDGRYQHLRAHWSEHTQLKFLIFFMFQALLSLLFSLTAYWVLKAPPIDLVSAIVAGLIGITALVGVSIADRQLMYFKRHRNRKSVCDVGLWRYSRHPNYFFEWVHWLVYPILLWQTAYFWWAVVVMFLMLVFLTQLTGIPYSERQALKSRGSTYRLYMKKTSPFVLWRPKND